MHFPFCCCCCFIFICSLKLLTLKPFILLLLILPLALPIILFPPVYLPIQLVLHHWFHFFFSIQCKLIFCHQFSITLFITFKISIFYLFRHRHKLWLCLCLLLSFPNQHFKTEILERSMMSRPSSAVRESVLISP